MAYKFLKWNGQYSGDARFVVEDTANGKQSMFTPGRSQDVVWTTNKLDETPEIKNWDDFGDETVDNLQDVAF